MYVKSVISNQYYKQWGRKYVSPLKCNGVEAAENQSTSSTMCCFTPSTKHISSELTMSWVTSSWESLQSCEMETAGAQVLWWCFMLSWDAEQDEKRTGLLSQSPSPLSAERADDYCVMQAKTHNERSEYENDIHAEVLPTSSPLCFCDITLSAY